MEIDSPSITPISYENEAEFILVSLVFPFKASENGDVWKLCLRGGELKTETFQNTSLLMEIWKWSYSKALQREKFICRQEQS